MGSETAKRTISGTSMASPHVCGVMALTLGEFPDLSPADLKAKVLSLATSDKITDVGRGSPNKNLFSAPQAKKAGAEKVVDMNSIIAQLKYQL